MQNQPSQLAGAGNNVGDTTLVLSNLLAIDGTTHLTMAMFGTKGYATIEPGNGTQEEQISFTGITNNASGTDTLTGVSTVLFISPYTETSGLAKVHAGGTQLVISNTAGFYNNFAVLSDAETISGVWTFSTVPVSATDPTGSTQVANKHYVDGVAIAGAPNATTAVKGIVQEATYAQILARTQAGSTGADLFVNPLTLPSTLLSDYVVDTGAANAYVITPAPAITAYATGQVFSFKAVSANTTTSTLAVNGLAAKTIKNSVGGNLAANDILAGQIIEVEYDGTNFQMLNISGNGYLDLQTNQTVAAGTKIFTVMPQSAAVPGTGNDITNKTYVDAQVATKVLGTWGNATADGAAHQVTTDGFLVGYATNAGGNALDVVVYTDSSNPPTTVRANPHNPTTTAGSILGWCVPVKKSDYYKISPAGGTTVTAAYFLPFGN